MIIECVSVAAAAYTLKTALEIAKSNECVKNTVDKIAAGANKIRQSVADGVAEAEAKKAKQTKKAVLGELLSSALEQSTPEERAKIVAFLESKNDTLN